MLDRALIQHADNRQHFILKCPFEFVLGGRIEPLKLVFETYGELSKNKDNAILIHHALSTNSHVSSHHVSDAPGWWEDMIGPGRPIDTNQYFVLCINNLASCFGSSGPASINPATQQAYRADFPIVTIADMANAQHLLMQQLGIERFKAIIGNSMGGMISLQWAIDYPNSVENLISISSCYKAYPANIANRVVQREIIQLDPNWQNGYYQTNPIDGLKVARKLGHFTYRNPDDFNQKFNTNHKEHPDKPCDVETYLDYNATKFVKNFDVNAYLYTLTAMDLYDISRHFASVQAALAQIRAKVLVISVDSDILFTPLQQHALFQALQTANVQSELINHHTNYGHDAFLVETKQFGQYISRFLHKNS